MYIFMYICVFNFVFLFFILFYELMFYFFNIFGALNLTVFVKYYCID